MVMFLDDPCSISTVPGAVRSTLESETQNNKKTHGLNERRKMMILILPEGLTIMFNGIQT